MKRFRYTSLWLLLAFALIAVVGVTFVDDIKVGDWTMKKAPVADYLLKERADKILSDSLRLDSIKKAEKVKVITTDSSPQSIFIFVDSMTFNLALRLAQYAKVNGHEIHSVNWDSSNTKIWAESDTLAHYINLYKPTQIFISLGSNELYFKDPYARAPYVKSIIAQIDTIPFVWIAPPNWKEDTGINDMLEEICTPGRFFRSAGMEFKRKKDNIHPTRESSALWIDSIMRWLPKSSHPFIANMPPDSIKKSNPNIVFLKAWHK
ncbi:MAG: hypothetical protein K2K97_11290 [Muribaculaceae bacterium]|nr:hypothetical protein [Muribaculaceae bacterium]